MAQLVVFGQPGTAEMAGMLADIRHPITAARPPVPSTRGSAVTSYVAGGDS